MAPTPSKLTIRIVIDTLNVLFDNLGKGKIKTWEDLVRQTNNLTQVILSLHTEFGSCLDLHLTIKYFTFNGINVWPYVLYILQSQLSGKIDPTILKLYMLTDNNNKARDDLLAMQLALRGKKAYIVTKDRFREHKPEDVNASIWFRVYEAQIGGSLSYEDYVSLFNKTTKSTKLKHTDTTRRISPIRYKIQQTAELQY